MGLCWLGGLRGLWGFCVREWLGGYMTCGVFAFLLSVFLFFSPAFCPLVLPCLPSCLLACLVCSCALVGVVSFSLSDYTQKERAQRVFPCVLSSCVVGCVYSAASGITKLL